MANELQYWHNGHPIIPGTTTVPDNLDYWSNGAPYTFIEISGTPSAATLKSINGLLLASVKSKDGLAKASIKSVNGLTTT